MILASTVLAGWICAGMLAIAVMSWQPRSTQPRTQQPSQLQGYSASGESYMGESYMGAEYEPLIADALASCIEAGMSIEHALTEIDESTGNALGFSRVATALSWGVETQKAFSYAPNTERIGSFVQVSKATGAPVAELLRQSGKHQRAANEDRAKAQAERLGVRVVIPLGLCALPAFICLGVVPVALALQPWNQ